LTIALNEFVAVVSFNHFEFLELKFGNGQQYHVYSNLGFQISAFLRYQAFSGLDHIFIQLDVGHVDHDCHDEYRGHGGYVVESIRRRGVEVG
jgi:hypothetical protein